MAVPRQLSATRKAVLAIGAVTLLAGALRFHALSRPPEKVFDETYYASDGCWYAGEPYRECDLEDDVERSWVHPPLGKQIIALGIDVFGNRPFGWRFSAALVGTATVALVGILAFLLFGSWLWAALATLLAGTEHLLFVQSRIAMLDVFLAFFILAGFVLLVADRRRTDRAHVARHRDLEHPPQPRRPFRYLAGAAFGAALAVKWSAVLALLAAVILAVAWERTRRREAGHPRPLLRAVQEEGIWIYVAFALVPLAVYLLPWIPWLADRSFDLTELVTHHAQMAEYHLELETLKANGEPIHPYMSQAWSWLLLTRPVAYYWQGDPSCCAEILGIGSPALFWGGLLVIPYLTLSWASRKEWQAGAIAVPILVQLLPWLAVGRPQFLFYMTPIAPFLALGMVYPLRDIVRSTLDKRLSSAAASIVVGVAVALFVFHLPVLNADHITYADWSTRMWFRGWI